MSEITYADEKAYAQRRAGLLPADAAADKVVLEARAQLAELEAAKSVAHRERAEAARKLVEDLDAERRVADRLERAARNRPGP